LKEVRRAARLAVADDFIEAMPAGYDTRVGFGGVELSGGQRQRIAIARTLLSDAPILLFDEATSAIDNETEAIIQRSLMDAAKDRTTIIVAHRLSTIRQCDLIYVIDDGRVREQGRHDELVRADGVYASMWRIQTGEAPPANGGAPEALKPDQSDAPDPVPAIAQFDVPDNMLTASQSDVPDHLPAVAQSDVPDNMLTTGQSDVPDHLPAVAQSDVPDNMLATSQSDVPDHLPAVKPRATRVRKKEPSADTSQPAPKAQAADQTPKRKRKAT
jgi:hypothetical protein